MATISSAIRLNDSMSNPLKNIVDAMNMMLSSWENLESATSDGLKVGNVDAIRNKLNQATQAIDQMGDEQEEFNRKVQEGASATDGLTNSIMGAVAALGLAKVAKDAIDYASDLQEVQNVVDVSFGKSSATIDEWAKTTLNSFGLSELSAKQFAGTMGAMLNSSGLTGDAVTEMSMALAELSGDMASFYNLSGEDAFAKIRAGISGETEPLKQLGINMSVANLEAFALSQGIKTAYNEMSQAEQITLRYNYLLQATANAQGDFARTSDSFANQQKLLTENWRAFTGELATNVLPMLAGLLAFLNDSIAFISDNWNVLAPILMGMVVAIGLYTAALVINTTITKINAFAQKLKAASDMMASGATFAATAAQYGFNAALMACPLTWIILLIIAVIAVIYAVVAAINNVTGSTISATGLIMGALATVAAFIYNLFVGLIDLTLEVVNQLVNPWIRFVNFFANIFNDPIASILYAFGSMADGILSVLESIASAIDAVFGSNLASAVSGWRSGLNGMIEGAVSKYGNGTYEEVVNELDLGAEDIGLKRWAYGDAYASGYNFGADIADSFGGMFGTDTATPEIPTFDSTGVGGSAELAEPSLGELKGINDGVEGVNDKLDVTHEDLKYLRDIAEQEVINRFTTAEIKVDMGGINNNINQTTDLDGVIDYMVTGVRTAMERAAEGVYA